MEKNQPNSNKKKKQLNDYARYSGMAFQMMAVILLGAFAGVKLDEVLNLKIPVFTLVFTLLAVGIAMYLFIKDVIKPKK